MKSDSIALKLRLAFIISMVLQCIVTMAVLICGGVISGARKNTFQIFYEKVAARASGLENEMKNVWTDIELYAGEIRQYFTDERLESGENQRDVNELLEDMAPLVLDTMSYTKTTGAFLILDDIDAESGSHAALYFKNANPNSSDEKNTSIYMLAGPWNVAERMKIVTDPEWSYRLVLDGSNRDFYEKPYDNMGLSKDASFLGYWSKPFKVTPGGEQVITYSIPLADKKGRPIGVFGVEISINYLYRSLPASELMAQDSLGYMIATKDGAGGELKASIIHGALQKRLVEQGQPFELELVDEASQIYLLKGREGGDVYANLREMGMYYNNTPFSDENWYLMGLIEKAALLEYPRQISVILGISFLISLCLGCMIAVMISRWFSKSSRLMELSELPVGAYEVRDHSNKVYMTMQVPRLLGLTREQEKRFSKDKNAFRQYLDSLQQNSEEKDGVILLRRERQDTWLRMTHKVWEGAVMGVVEDVTDEILQKRELTMERDFDGLTGVKNRMAFERESGELLEKKLEFWTVMCDLNNLKEVNDQYGHLAGDEYIRFAVSAIQDTFHAGTVYRIGGDEFVILIEEGLPEVLEEQVVKLQREVLRYNQSADFEAGIAVGYAFYNPKGGEDFNKILARADQAMYANKREMASRQ